MAARRVLAVLALVSVNAVFAGYQVLGKLVLRGGLDPIAFSLLRELGASAVFLAAAACLVPASKWPRREHLWRFFVCGASMFGNVFLMLLGLDLTTPSMVALLQPTQPIFASVLAACLRQESMGPCKAVGVAASCAGSLLLSLAPAGSGPGHGLGGRAGLGVLVILAQCACGANYVVQQRPLLQAGYPPLIVASCAYAAATALTAATGATYFACLAPGARAAAKWWDPSALFVAVLLYVVFLATVYNYVAMAWATGQLGATLVTLFGLLQGAFACTLAWFCCSVPVLPLQALGGVVVSAGLVLVVRSSAAAPDQPEGPWARWSNAPDLAEAVQSGQEVRAYGKGYVKRGQADGDHLAMTE